MPEMVEEVSDWIETPDPVASPEPAAPAATPAAPLQSPTAETGPSGSAAGPDDDDGGEDTETEQVRDSRGRWQTRAKKDKAGARIMKLANELRQTREELAAIRARVPEPQRQPSTPPHAYQVPDAPTTEFAEPEPQLNDFADKEDPYGAWQRALARYDRRKEEAEAMRTHQQAHVQRLSKEQEAMWAGVFNSHNARLQQTIAAKPELVQAFAQIAPRSTGKDLSLMNHAIAVDTEGVSMAVFLATHPAVFDELVLLTAARPVNQQTVETTQRWLRQRMTPVGSGAGAPSPVLTPAPRPPTPLRTAPMTIGETVPGDDDSLEAHEQHFHKPRGFRR